jgi:hypothetical protein
MDTSKEKIFDKVVNNVVDAAVDGYNGSIFSYSQTGSTRPIP